MRFIRKRRGYKSTKKFARFVAIFFLTISLNFPTFSQVFAQADLVTSSENGLYSAETNSLTPIPTGTILTPEPEAANTVETNYVTTTSPSTVRESTSEVAQERGPPEKLSKNLTKFKKDSSLSLDQELTKVKQHLADNDLPQNIIDRVDAFKTKQSEGPQKIGFFKRIFNYFSGNTDADKERKEVEKIANKQPFKVKSFSGQINKKQESEYGKLFNNNQEQGSLLQKVRNLLKGGKIYNSNFDNTQKRKGLSLFFAPNAQAASNNPNDYLTEGNEIIFSQALKDKADSLSNDPLTILNYVRNNVDYVPYYGSKKGSDATLIERAGNDMDKSTLLISMLRYSGIPARYRHIDAKMSVNEVTDLLGVQSPDAAAEVLTLNNFPFLYFTDSENNPVFFVLEHTYVEAYIPYGYSRGADINDGGTSQWVPMDPTINAYYYEQPIDIIGEMKTDGFDVISFYDDYLQNNYGTSSPYSAFKSEVVNFLAARSPTSTFEDAVVRVYPKQQNLSFIPGTLPYQTVVDLNTYDYIPSSLRHTIQFQVFDDQQNSILDTTTYVSDLADKELLVTYEPATQDDQDTLNTFDTIYDVVPLSLIAVNAKIKINGVSIATSTATSTLGRNQNYQMIFKAPMRAIGDPIEINIIETKDENIITGNTNAIAINTDRVVPPELRPNQDTATNSFVSNKMLYKTALDYLYRLGQNEKDLAKIFGSDYTHQATRAAVFNGIAVTYSNGEPYSFDWKGLRIDSMANVAYFNRFNDITSTHKKEFMAICGLQGSLDESNIFEDNFNVESISTVKGLKLVASSTFPGITFHKITTANESDIDSLSVTSTTKTIFHTAVQAGKTIYAPSAPFTYGNWTGLVYITINFNNGLSGYIIGEGLNGGYTVEQFRFFGDIFWKNLILSTLTADITIPTNNQTFYINQKVDWSVHYSAGFETSTVLEWTENDSLGPFPLGTTSLRTGYGTTSSVNIQIQEDPNPLDINYKYMIHGCDNSKKTGNCVSGTRGRHDITQVVIHYTAGGNVKSGPIDTFLKIPGPSAHYIIDRDGQIYQMVDLRNLSKHDGCVHQESRIVYDSTGKAQTVYDCVDLYGAAGRTIGIELNNYGFLNETADPSVFRTNLGAEVPGRYNYSVYDNTTSWRGYRYWEDAYPEQIDSLNNLIDYLDKEYDFNKQIYGGSSTPDIINLKNESQLVDFNGILGHSNIADYKSDPGPAFQHALFNLWNQQ